MELLLESVVLAVGLTATQAELDSMVLQILAVVVAVVIMAAVTAVQAVQA
jgi:hypothetical protein